MGGCSPSEPARRGRTRLVPLHPSAVAALADYAGERARRFGPPGESDAFFRTDASEKISYNAANHAFSVVRRRLGWTAEGRTRTPRVHDLRHRMVVRRIEAWHAQGVDVDAKIPALATYLGHVEVRDVYWYLSAVPELMSIIAQRFEHFAATTRRVRHESAADRVHRSGPGLLPAPPDRPARRQRPHRGELSRRLRAAASASPKAALGKTRQH